MVEQRQSSGGREVERYRVPSLSEFEESWGERGNRGGDGEIAASVKQAALSGFGFLQVGVSHPEDPPPALLSAFCSASCSAPCSTERATPLAYHTVPVHHPTDRNRGTAAASPTPPWRDILSRFLSRFFLAPGRLMWLGPTWGCPSPIPTAHLHRAVI